MDPAIRTARHGFAVTEDLVDFMRDGTEEGDFLSNDPTWALDFAPNGTRLGLGDIMTRRRYAATLETIAQHGADAFYSGAMAEAMVNAVQAANGTMTLEDVKNYTVALRDTASIDYRGFKVTSGTAPSSGAVLLSILKLVGGYEDFFDEPDTLNISTHRLDEAMRFGYGQVIFFSLVSLFTHLLAASSNPRPENSIRRSAFCGRFG